MSASLCNIQTPRQTNLGREERQILLAGRLTQESGFQRCSQFLKPDSSSGYQRASHVLMQPQKKGRQIAQKMPKKTYFQRVLQNVQLTSKNEPQGGEGRVTIYLYIRREKL